MGEARIVYNTASATHDLYCSILYGARCDCKLATPQDFITDRQ
jgi:hypothetical protein